MSLRRGNAVTDPQFLCAAIGDSKSDKTPLQVTQFESDIRIIRQLTDLYLEGGGGGNYGESYHLLWYFAAYRTAADCFEKRGKKAGDKVHAKAVRVDEKDHSKRETIDFEFTLVEDTSGNY